MRRALSLAERGWGRVPNPTARRGRGRAGREIVGEGFHGEYGGARAEVVALRAAGGAGAGRTLYVTLERATTTARRRRARTRSWRRASRGSSSPRTDHPVARGGAERLRAAGIEVVVGVERDAARALNAAFFHAVERGHALRRLEVRALAGRPPVEPAGAADRPPVTGEEARPRRTACGPDSTPSSSGSARRGPTTRS